MVEESAKKCGPGQMRRLTGTAGCVICEGLIKREWKVSPAL